MRPEDRDIRASDADRETTAELLREHCAAGRLTVTELEERLTTMAEAHTVAQLRALVADLPPADAAGPDRRARNPLAPRRFALRHDFAHPTPVVFDEAVASIVPAMTAAGFAVEVRSGETTLLFERMSVSRRAGNQFVHVALEDSASGAVMHVHGLASRRVRQAFANLSRP